MLHGRRLPIGVASRREPADTRKQRINIIAEVPPVKSLQPVPTPRRSHHAQCDVRPNNGRIKSREGSRSLARQLLVTVVP
jgi:hypothetical protein